MKAQKIERDEFGLVKGIDYVFKEDGRRVDWRAMIPSEYLVVNKENFEARKEEIPEDISKVEDKDLLILLEGFKYLADLRGYESVAYSVESSPHHCTTICSIVWFPNFETENTKRMFSSVGDANTENTKGFGKNFLGPIAENRAFVRAVRNFLRIPVLGKDEIPLKNFTEESSPSPAVKINALTEKLESLMLKKKVGWNLIKNKLVQEGVSGADGFLSIHDLPPNVVISLIERLNKKKAVK